MKTAWLTLAILLAFLKQDALAVTVRIWEEVPYFSAQDSPFFEGIQAGTIFLEDFEDQELNTPHVTSWDYPRVVGIGPLGPALSRQQGTSFRALSGDFVAVEVFTSAEVSNVPGEVRRFWKIKRLP